MSLRIVGNRPAGVVANPEKPDGPIARIAKLIPAEALGLYSAGLPVISGASAGKGAMLIAWALVALAFCAIVRLRETRDPAGKPQVAAVVISLISFAIWLLMLPEGSTPLFLAGSGPWLTLSAIAWGALVPLIYKG